MPRVHPVFTPKNVIYTTHIKTYTMHWYHCCSNNSASPTGPPDIVILLTWILYMVKWSSRIRARATGFCHSFFPKAVRIMNILLTNHDTKHPKNIFYIIINVMFWPTEFPMNIILKINTFQPEWKKGVNIYLSKMACMDQLRMLW